MIAILRHMGILRDTVDEETESSHTEDTQTYDDGDHDQNNLQSAASAGGRSLWRRRDRGCELTWSNRSCSNRTCRSRSAAFVAELCPRIQSRTTGIAECHTSPRSCYELDARVYRRTGSGSRGSGLKTSKVKRLPLPRGIKFKSELATEAGGEI